MSATRCLECTEAVPCEEHGAPAMTQDAHIAILLDRIEDQRDEVLRLREENAVLRRFVPREVCPDCGGDGANADDMTKDCPECRGSGKAPLDMAALRARFEELER